MEYIIASFAALLIVVLVAAYIFKSVFQIEKQTEKMNQQLRIIAKIAKYNNVPTEEIEEVLGIKKGSVYSPVR